FTRSLDRPSPAAPEEDGVLGNRRATRIPSWGIGPKSRKPEGCYSRPFAACELGLRCWPAIALPTDSKARRGRRGRGGGGGAADSRRGGPCKQGQREMSGWAFGPSHRRLRLKEDGLIHRNCIRTRARGGANLKPPC